MRRLLILLFLLQGFEVMSQDLEVLAEAERKRFSALKEYDIQSISSNNYDVKHYRCQWNIDPAVRYISGSVTTRFMITASTNNIIFDMSSALTIDSVKYQGNLISATKIAGNGLRINFPATLPAGQLDSVTVHYQGTPPSTSAFAQGMHSNVRIIWTLSEPYGARTWWPCKDMLRDKADSIDIIITNPSAFVSSSNGLPVSETVTGSQRTTHWKHRYPIVSYLVALAITNYTTISDAASLPSGTMPMMVYAYPESAAAFAQANTVAKTCLEEFSKLITEYPFRNERYAQTQFSVGGGMEHQTNSFIGSPGDALVAHELGHQWFGDKVTCGSWSDLWLNEGFASYMEYLYTELTNPGGRIALLQSWRNNITQLNNGSVYVTDTLNESRLFSSRLTYRKGGYLVHMLRWKLGDSSFFRGVRRYLNDPLLAYGNALSTDLQRNLQDESGQNLTEFFNDWLYGEGHPDYSAQWSQQANFDVQVKLNQTPSHPSVSFFEMPVPLRFTSATKDTTIIVNHTQSGQIFSFNIGFAAQDMIIDPELWILTKNKTTQKVSSVTSIGTPPGFTGYSIAPNPARQMLMISLPGNSARQLKVEIINAAGQLVWKRMINGNTKQYEIPVDRFAAGLHYLRISDERELKWSQTILVSKQ